jgi:hypothetical protein
LTGPLNFTINLLVNQKRLGGSYLLLFLCAAGAAVFLNLIIQARRFTILDHVFSFSFFPFFLLLIIGLALLAAVWVFSARFEAKKFGIDPAERFRESSLALIPLLVLFLSPLLTKHYLSRGDLRTRLILLALFAVLAVLYLKFVDYSRVLRGQPFFLKKWRIRFWGLPLKKKLVWMFLGAFLIYNACALALVVQGVTFSGDEPNYLLMSHSLLKDKDIDLSNNFAHKDYFYFYDKEKNPRLTLGINGRYGKDGKLYSVNLPGVSVLMLPWYGLSQLFKGTLRTFILKGSLSLWAALLGLQVYLLARERLRRETLSFVLWIFTSFSVPVLFYAIHLYPEIPIACASVYIFRKIVSPAPLSPVLVFFLGFLLAAFPWFGVKYYAIFWPLLAVALFYLIKHHRSRSAIYLLCFFPAISVILFHAFLFRLYGTLSPLSVYAGIMTPEQSLAAKEALLGMPLRARIDALLDYFLDQRDGLLLYSPFYFFMFLGLVEMVRKARRELLAMIIIGLPFILTWALVTNRAGRCPQGRVLAPLIWIGAVLIGYFLAFNRNKLFQLLFRGAAFLGLVIAVILLSHPPFLYQPTTHEYTQRAGDLFIFLSNLQIFLPSALPSFLQMRNADYLPNYCWILAIMAFVAFYIVLKNKRSEPLGPAFHALLAGVLVLAASAMWVLYPRSVLYPVRTFTYASQRTLGFYLFPLGRDVVAKNGAELYLHTGQPRQILFSSRKKLERVKLVYGSEQGEYDVKLQWFDLPFIEGRTTNEKKEWVSEPPGYYPFRNLYLYQINFAFKKKPTESLLVNPYFLQIVPLKD